LAKSVKLLLVAQVVCNPWLYATAVLTLANPGYEDLDEQATSNDNSSAAFYGWEQCWGWSIWGSIRSATISMSFKLVTSRLSRKPSRREVLMPRLSTVFSRRVKQKGITVLAEFSQANIPTIGLGLVAKNAFIRERQDVLGGVLKGLSEAVAFILSPNYKPVVLKTIMQHLRITDPATAEEGYQDLLTGIEKKALPSIEGLRNTQAAKAP